MRYGKEYLDITRMRPNRRCTTMKWARLLSSTPLALAQNTRPSGRQRSVFFIQIFLFTSFNMSLWLSDLKTIILAALIFLEKPKKYGPVPFIKFYSHLPIFPLTNWILNTILTLVIFLEKPKKYGPVFSVEKVEGGKEGSGNSGFSSYRSPYCVWELHSYFSEAE